MSEQQGGTPFQDPRSATTDYSRLAFVFTQLLRGKAFATIVSVQACSNDGGIVPVGTVDVLPLVNQVDGAGNPTPHTTIYGLPYTRVQGGDNAVIIDPAVGDLGIAVFASRDISNVVATKAQAGPGSNRICDYADGMYIGGLLNGTPVNYVLITDSLAKVFHTTKIVLSAPTVEVDASTKFNVVSPDSEFSGNITAQGTIIGVTQVVQGSGGSAVHLSSHEHSGVTPGGGVSGAPVPGS